MKDTASRAGETTMKDTATKDVEGLKRPSYDAIEVGEELGPLRVTIDDHYVKRYAYAVEDYQPWALRGESPFGGRIAQAGVLVAPLLRLWNTRYDPNADIGLHQKEEIWFESPVHLGEQVLLRGEVTDKYVKRGKEYVVTEAAAYAASDERVIVRHRATEIVEMNSSIELGAGSASGDRGGAPARRVAAEYPDGAVPVLSATPELPIGAPIAAPAKQIHQAQMSVYSNVEEFWRTSHTDLATARRAGFEGTLAQALMGTMRIAELGTSLFAGAWFHTGWIAVSYLKPIYAEDRLAVRGVLVDSRPEVTGVRLEFEVWLENQRSEKVSVGWMSAVAK
jgi:acyl dehydratase